MMVNKEPLQPREQLMRYGAASLTNEQLAIVILRSGNHQYSVAEIAHKLLTHYPDFRDLEQASLTQLETLSGIGPVKAVELQAICEMSRRLQAQRTLRFGVVASSQMVGYRMLETLAGETQEQLLAVFLDVKNQIIQTKQIYIGTLNSSVAHPREVFKLAVQYSAAKFILVHNHPSGQLSPSTQDIAFTKRIIACGEFMGIACLDHLIIGSQQYLSLREEGYLVE
ncbi:RadC family protein [Latilactobacillus graminis]|uniref:DNA repair RadC family protein n=2 Tax=Latilactobacillus graminis TaxID=60519 RepID=A0AA89I0F0_9LACO|nr:DNA repair protein RadC [Latilactobacillus graminis]KRM22287.1 DNA repair RadC family protein [Latilactobacillus graminis DSM 20719]QFP79537.1 JAB domain-containing protein [Latilactobacillus graminis]